MATVEGRHWLVFNGEIYNHRELREGFPHGTFHTSSDTETLLCLLARDGIGCLDKLRGMYAFAWLDTTTGRLTLARDPFGIKPLYIAEKSKHLAFASEPRSLLALPWIGREADPDGVADYLAYGLTDHREGTCFGAIRSLPPGTWRAWSIGNAVTTAGGDRHWHPPSIQVVANPQHVRDSMLTSVREHLLSDVPLGTTLSGGIDSSAIIACMREVVGPGAPIHAIAYHADDQQIGEERWIRLASERVGAQVVPVRFADTDLAADIDDLIRCQSEPFGSTSIYAQYRVMRQARESGLTVMLGGQGADELFAGYRIHQAARVSELILGGRFAGALKLKCGLPDLSWRTIAGQMLPPWRAWFGLRPSLPEWIDQRRLPGLGSRPFSETPGKNLLRRRLRESFVATSLPMLLRYEDRNAMRWGVENRVPFVHRPLVELAMGLPAESLVADDGTSKHVLRQAMRGLVPNEILERRDKIGFATPERRILDALGSWADRLVEAHGRRVRCIDIDRFRAHWRSVRQGHRPYSFSVWRTLNLLRWSDLFQVEVL